VHPNTENDEPKRAKDLNDKVAPKDVQSSTATDEPIREIPKIEKVEPMRK
jgi:hypothetical protein